MLFSFFYIDIFPKFKFNSIVKLKVKYNKLADMF